MKKQIRKSATERRREIALTALRIIDEQGLVSLSTSTLAKELGLSTGAPFKHFASWEEIYREMAKIGLDRFEETFPDKSLPGFVRLFELSKNRIKTLQSTPGLIWLFRSEQAYLTIPEDSVTALKGMAKRSKRYILNAIEDSVIEGCMRNDIDPQEVLVIVMGTIHALSSMPGIHKLKKEKSPDKVLKTLKTLLAL